ncbi:hypothetical protein GCM10009760_31770 [Kitasatospora kazusensis]|uniref:SPOR domain-containing protein n=1 Tax=Kitasatospora kazusensis TaxID=407974 RepID=A0ABN2ZM78_9ACTN
MGIFDRFRHKAHEEADPAQRAALAHDEAADAFAVDVERSAAPAPAAPAPVSEPMSGRTMSEQDRLAAENMTAEGDPWD